MLLAASMCAAVLVAVAVPAAAEPARWAVRAADSEIGFSGTHAGRPFTGRFGNWRADITFDPADLAGSKAVVTVDLASASTGDATYDKTLPTSDWLDTGRFGAGVFTTSGFVATGQDAYTAQGELELRGVKVPVALDFTFQAEGDVARLEGKTRLQRLAFGIGKGSDATGAWVSLDVPVTVKVALERMR
ncbi:MAG: YceI family protein [Hyphomicrobiaceae bacterium]|nr:YceI family protein [Hyphomicrobiaceae bacterium]